MKRLVLMIAVALPQVTGAQSDPFMDLSMPSLDDPAPQEGVMQSGEDVPPQKAETPADHFMDLTLPEMDAPVETAEQEKIVQGCVVPGRPEWTIDFPPRERQKGTLLRIMHERLWLSKVTESQSCSCENRWPKWDETEAAFKLYMKDLDMTGVTTVYQAISKGNDSLIIEANKICSEENS